MPLVLELGIEVVCASHSYPCNDLKDNKITNNKTGKLSLFITEVEACDTSVSLSF
jgi:hypothetical protein